MEASEIPFHYLGPMADMDPDPPYPGTSIPGAFPQDFWTNPPSNMSAVFSTRRGVFAVRGLPDDPPLQVVRSNSTADVLYATEKYTKQFPDIVNRIQQMPAHWEDLFEYFDPLELFVEGAAFCYHVIHRIAWHTLMKKRRFTRLVESWCSHNISKLATLPFTGSPVKKLLDARDWHYFNFSNIPELDMNVICEMLDRQAFELRPIIDQFMEHAVPSSDLAFSQGLDHTRSPLALQGPSSPVVEAADINKPVEISQASHETRTVPTASLHGKGHLAYEALPQAQRRDMSKGGYQEGAHQQCQPGSTPVRSVTVIPRTNASGSAPLSEPDGPSKPPRILHRASSGYSITETLAELKDDTESPVPRVALPGQPQRAPEQYQSERTIDILQLFNPSLDYTIAAAEKRLIGIRIADAYDTAAILKSDMIPKIMATCGEIESYRPKNSDAELTFVSATSAEAACRFNNQSVNDGPKLLVFLIPNFDNSPNPAFSIMDTSHGSLAGAVGLPPPDVAFSTQPYSRARVDIGSSWASAAVFIPQARGNFYDHDPATMRPEGANTTPHLENRATNSMIPNANLSSPRVHAAPPARTVAPPAPVVHGYSENPRAPHMGLRNNSFQTPRITRRPSQPFRRLRYLPRAGPKRTGNDHNTCENNQPAKVLSNSVNDYPSLLSSQADHTQDFFKLENRDPSGSEMGSRALAHTEGKRTDSIAIPLGPRSMMSTARSDWKKPHDQFTPTNVAGVTPYYPTKETDSSHISLTSSTSLGIQGSAQQPASFKNAKEITGLNKAPPNAEFIMNMDTSSDSTTPFKSVGYVKNSTTSGDSSLSCYAKNDACLTRPQRQIYVPQASFSITPIHADINQHEDPVSTEVILVPRSIRLWIIGHNGYSVKRLEAVSGCQIELPLTDPPNSDGYPNMVSCFLTGHADVRTTARAMIHRLVADAEAHGDDPAWPDTFFLPSNIADVVTGRYGADVTRIEGLTRTVFHFDAEDEPGVRIRRCLLAGPTSIRPTVLEQIDCIADNIRMERSSGAIGAQSFPVDFGQERQFLHLANGAIRRCILDIRLQTLCQIYVLLSDPQTPSTTLCQIIGPHANLAAASLQFNQFLSSIDGGTPQPPSGSDTFAISNSAAFYVVDQSREYLRSLEFGSGCKIDVQRDPELLIHLVTVTGNHRSRPDVVAEIRRLAAESEMRAPESSMGGAESLRLILQCVTAPDAETTTPSNIGVERSTGDAEGIRRLFESVTAPQTENGCTARSEHSKSRTSIRLEDVERVPALADNSRQHSESFSGDIEVCAEDIRRSATYGMKPAGGEISMPVADEATPGHFAPKTQGTAGNSFEAAELPLQLIATAGTMLPPPSAANPSKGKYASKFHKKVRPSEHSFEGDSTVSADYQSSDPVKRTFKKKSRKIRKTPAAESGQDSSFSMITTDDSASAKLGAENTTNTKCLKAPKMPRQDSVRSMGSATSARQGAKGHASRDRRPVETAGSFNQKAEVPDVGIEGDSSLSSFSETNQFHRGTGTSTLIRLCKSAADLKQEKAAATATTKHPVKKSTPGASPTETNHEQRCSRKLEPDVVNVLDDPKEWPTLSGRSSAQSISDRAVSPIANARSPSGRRDSMAEIAGRAKVRMMTDAPSLSRPSSLSGPQREKETDYVDHGLRVASNSTVNSDVTVVPVKEGLATKEWPMVVKWSKKNVSLTTDLEAEETQELNSWGASEEVSAAAKENQQW